MLVELVDLRHALGHLLVGHLELPWRPVLPGLPWAGGGGLQSRVTGEGAENNADLVSSHLGNEEAFFKNEELKKKGFYFYFSFGGL